MNVPTQLAVLKFEHIPILMKFASWIVILEEAHH